MKTDFLFVLQCWAERHKPRHLRKLAKPASGASQGWLAGMDNAISTEAVFKEQSVNVSFSINPLFVAFTPF
jgi:hypothetical protein